ncbi:hypothetical protein ACNKHQ_18895 [Shigella flexneri]
MQLSQPWSLTPDSQLFEEPVETVQDVHRQLKTDAPRAGVDRPARYAGQLILQLGRGRDASHPLLKRGVIRQCQNQRPRRRDLEVKWWCARNRRASPRDELLLAHHALLRAGYFCSGWWTLDLLVAGRRYDCRGHLAGNASAEPAHGGDRLYLRHHRALPLGQLDFLIIIPATQQSMLLLCISLAVMWVFIGD